MKQSEQPKMLAKKLNIALILIAIAAIAVAAVLFFSIPEDVKAQCLDQHKFFAQGAEGKMPLPFHYGRGHHRHGIILFVIIAIIIIAAVKHKMMAFHMFHRFKGGNSAMEILRREYATGDISKEEYLARKEVLERGEGGEE